MPADFDTGMFVREAAWHGQGTLVQEHPESWAEARTLAGLDWEPGVAPLFGQTGIDEDGNVVYGREVGIQKVVRSDTADRIGVVSEGYHLINHAVMGQIYEAVREELKRVMKIETMGSLQNGAKVWVLAQVGDPITIDGDPSEIKPYAALLNAHDGSGALKGIGTSIRVVCMNTWHMAEADASRDGTVGIIKHTANWRHRIPKVVEAMTGARREAEELAEWFQSLTGVAVSDQQLREFNDRFWWPKDRGAALGDIARANIEESIAKFMQFYRSRSCDGPKVRGTAYGVMQGMGEYMDYGRELTGKNEDKRRDQLTQRTLLTPEAMKRRAAKVLGEVVGVSLLV